MNYTTLAIFILLLNITPLFFKTQQTKRIAYQWWHIPWFAVLYVILMSIIFHKFNVNGWPVFSTLYGDGVVEACYVLLSQFLWYVIAIFLRRPAVHKKLLPWLRIAFGQGDDDTENILPFPYFIDYEDTVRARVGRAFYRNLLGGVVVLVALIYAICFILMQFMGIPFYLLSAFGLFGTIPLIDYYRYLGAEVPEEEMVIKKEELVSSSSDLEKLWQRYVDVFSNYSVAWSKSFQDNDFEHNNKVQVEDLLARVTHADTSRAEDGFLENCDLTQAFLQMEPLFNWEEQNGWLVLVIYDIPNHFTKRTGISYLREVADRMREMLHHKDLAVYDEYTSDDVLNSSIVVASLNVLSQRNVDEEWLKRIGLVVVVNLLDKSVSNLYECRKFSYLLDSVNEQYQMLFITPHLRGVEPSLRNIWKTRAQTAEKRMKQFPQSHRQFFIGYDFEDYLERYKSILPSLPTEPLSAISEMAPIALSYKEGEEEKDITPVHFFDLAYTNIVEGIEELVKFYNSESFPVRDEDINKHIYCHQLPVDVIDEAQVFSVIFDQDNNAPAAYDKWIHLGSHENFSVVISKPYIFRDYFNDNHDFFTNMPFVALQPQLSKSRVTLAVILLNMLQKSGMDERQLLGLLSGYYKEEEIQSLAGTVRQLFTTYFSSDLAGRLSTSHFIDFNGSKYQHRATYELDYADNVNLSYLDYITIKDESDNVLFAIIKDLLFQNFEKGQIHSFLGKPYEVMNYEEDNKVLRVRAANTQAINVVFYRPVQQIVIGDQRCPIEDMSKENRNWYHSITGDSLGLDFDGFETQVSVTVNRWYAFNRYGVRDCTYTDVNPGKKRTYNNGRVLKVSFRYLKKIEYINRIDDIRKGLQILLYEAMQSVFPHHAQYLIVSSVGEGDDSLPWIFNQCQCKDKDEQGTLTFFFIEDAHVDMGLIGALAQNDCFGPDYLFKYIYDYLLWLKEDNSVSDGEYDKYLHADRDKLAFLKYGKDALPTYFDIDLLIGFIRDFFCEGQLKSIRQLE